MSKMHTAFNVLNIEETILLRKRNIARFSEREFAYKLFAV